MAVAPPRATHDTHEVTNQSAPLEDYNVFEADRPLVEAVSREGGDLRSRRSARSARIAGRRETIELGRLANENPPKLRTHDRFGNRIDEVEFHPAWHELMDVDVAHGLHALPWREPEPGAHVARAAAFMCLSQAEAGIGCPISMTYSVIPALRAQPELADGLGAALPLARLRPAPGPRRGQGRRPGRDGDDREAGRLRRAREHDRRGRR